MTTNNAKAAVVCNRAVEHYVGFRADTMAVLNDALADGPLGRKSSRWRPIASGDRPA
jgi:hypothetical protein